MAQQVQNRVVVSAPAPRHFHVPLREITLAVIILIAVGAIVYGVTWAVSRGGENASAPTVPAIQQPVAQPFDPSTSLGAQGKPVQQVQVGPAVENPPAQTKPEVVAPMVVDYQVTWTEMQGFDPSSIPVEEGFYKGRPDNIVGWNSEDALKYQTYALKIYPELENIAVGFGAVAVATRDQEDRRIVLVGVHAVYDEREEGRNSFKREVRIALSVDGEKSWCNLSVLPYSNGRTSVVRVKAEGNFIHLYAVDARAAVHWWTATVDKSTLPCS